MHIINEHAYNYKVPEIAYKQIFLNVFKKRHIKNMENKLRYPNANITIG